MHPRRKIIPLTASCKLEVRCWKNNKNPTTFLSSSSKPLQTFPILTLNIFVYNLSPFNQTPCRPSAYSFKSVLLFIIFLVYLSTVKPTTWPHSATERNRTLFTTFTEIKGETTIKLLWNKKGLLTLPLIKWHPAQENYQLCPSGLTTLPFQMRKSFPLALAGAIDTLFKSCYAIQGHEEYSHPFYKSISKN